MSEVSDRKSVKGRSSLETISTLPRLSYLTVEYSQDACLTAEI